MEGCAGLIAVSEEMLDELDGALHAPAARRCCSPTTRCRATSPRRPAPAAEPRRAAAGRLPGEPVGQRQPLRPARPVRAPSAAPGCDRRLPQPRRARLPGAGAAHRPGMRLMDAAGAGRAAARAAGLRRRLGRLQHRSTRRTWTPRCPTRPSSTWPPACRSRPAPTGRCGAWWRETGVGVVVDRRRRPRGAPASEADLDRPARRGCAERRHRFTVEGHIGSWPSSTRRRRRGGPRLAAGPACRAPGAARLAG